MPGGSAQQELTLQIELLPWPLYSYVVNAQDCSTVFIVGETER